MDTCPSCHSPRDEHIGRIFCLVSESVVRKTIWDLPMAKGMYEADMRDSR